MTQDISLDTLPRIQWDANVFVRALVTGSDDLLDFLLNLYEQHDQKIIRFHNPLAVQSEFYGILAAVFYRGTSFYPISPRGEIKYAI